MEKAAKCPMCDSINLGSANEIFILDTYAEIGVDKKQSVDTGNSMKLKAFFCHECGFVGLMSVGKIELAK